MNHNSTAYWTLKHFQQSRDTRLKRVAEQLNRNYTQDAITEFEITQAYLENLNADIAITERFI